MIENSEIHSKRNISDDGHKMRNSAKQNYIQPTKFVNVYTVWDTTVGPHL